MRAAPRRQSTLLLTKYLTYLFHPAFSCRLRSPCLPPAVHRSHLSLFSTISITITTYRCNADIEILAALGKVTSIKLRLPSVSFIFINVRHIRDSKIAFGNRLHTEAIIFQGHDMLLNGLRLPPRYLRRSRVYRTTEARKYSTISNIFRRWMDSVKEADSGSGCVPDHPPRQLVITEFLRQHTMVEIMRGPHASNHMLPSEIPPSYPPSVRATDSLRPIAVSQLELEKHHRGQKVIIRVITPAVAVKAVMAVVEDEEGTAVMLQLYYQLDSTMVDPDDVLTPGMVLIVKEPFFKQTIGGPYSIRVDHVSDVVWLQDTDSRIPPKWRRNLPRQTNTPAAIREQGDIAMKQNKFAKAEKL